MTELTGGAYGPNPRAYLDEDAARDAAEASAEILEQRRPRDPEAPRSRWERVRIEGEWVEVEVERLEPPRGDEDA